MREAIGGAAAIADLFAGLGTFALAVRAAYAAEASRDAAAALKRAAPASRSSIATSIAGRSMPPSWSASMRSILDPPRAGAAEQVAALAALSRAADRLRQLQPGDLRA